MFMCFFVFILFYICSVVFGMSVKSKTGLRGSRRKFLVLVSLLLVVVVLLVCSLFVYQSLMADDGFVRVKSAVELRDAVNNVEVCVQLSIALTEDISLGSALTIPAGADITLRSVGGAGFFKLVGLTGGSVITVQSGGRLTLDGVIVTHVADSIGNGVIVESGGALIMIDGVISGNTAFYGGGVQVHSGGVFELIGGVISGNTASRDDAGYGGGVSNAGTFKMYGGKISDNTVAGRGGGVSNAGDFSMFGGVISGNAASNSGGGVDCTGSFSMFGGVISNNVANVSGGGAFIWVSFYVLSGDTFSSFMMSGGTISDNYALNGYGGGVYTYNGTFDKLGGEIFDNTAAVGNDVHQWSG